MFIIFCKFAAIKPVQASPKEIDSLKNVLSQLLIKKPTLDKQKRQYIETLQKQLHANYASLNQRYTSYQNLFNAYKSFIHDSAYVYSKKAIATANLLKDQNKINYSKLNLGFVLVSSGMFKEGIDTLKAVKPQYLNPGQQFEYYFFLARSNFDLADFDKIPYYHELYTRKGLTYCDTIITKFPAGSYENQSASGLKLLRSEKYEQAIATYQKLLKSNISYRDSAVNFSCLSFLYFRVNKPDLGLSYLIKSAIIDNVHSIKESLALANLSKYLYQHGMVRESFTYIHSAIEDNSLYGAKQRKVEISNILPIIERDMVNDIEHQKRSLLIYASTITVLIILIIYFAYITSKQLKKLRIADQLIINQNNELNIANTNLLKINNSLDTANQSLTITNHKLDEANMIKEEYIGHFFNVNADYIDKLDRLKRALQKVVAQKQYDELQVIMRRLDTNLERENFYRSFDEVFLNLFPNFINEFNSLFDEEHKTLLSPGQLLNNELRIFALIRLGIEENETIAKILNYSVNTIYTYKTKIKNRSLVPNEEFQEHILHIRTVNTDISV
ncbi:MAG: tetratricopeptide repeat protein [Pedobacter sp.]|nr:MAG: tetratricopeptide repeat protein [Pedobacter sp.]